MRAFSFLHCADLHLGATIKTLTGLPTEFEPRLINAPIAALDRIVTTAIEKKVAGVIMAGDVFDNTLPSSVHSYAALRDRLQKLRQTQTWIFPKETPLEHDTTSR